MRPRISLLVVATSSLVLVSFLVPLALVLRTLAADRAVSAATAQAQSLAPLVTTLETGNLRLTVDQVNAETSTPVTSSCRRAPNSAARARLAGGPAGPPRPQLLRRGARR